MALISGGLDSILAARLIQLQGIQVIGIHCGHPFHAASPRGERPFPERAAAQIGIELVEREVTEKILDLVQNPPHGYGRNLNPCIDCRILYLGEAHELMKERGAGFIITGEVLGQRPMSQRRDALDIIDRDAALRGLVLRPLSARLLRPTMPEEKGWVEREKLLAVNSRGRKKQIALAEKFGITEFSTPAGGCLLTNEGFAAKVKDLLEHEKRLTSEDVQLLKVGRHFRLSDRAKLVAGRDERENEKIIRLAIPADLIIESIDHPGPLGLLRKANRGLSREDPSEQAEMMLACSILGRYVKPPADRVCFEFSRTGTDERGRIEAPPLSRSEVARHLAGNQDRS